MFHVTFAPALDSAPAWDRGLRIWLGRGGGGARRLVWITPRLDPRWSPRPPAGAPAVPALLEELGTDPRSLLVVGPGELVPDAAAPDYGALLRRGVAVVPQPVLDGRDGLPAVRRALARWPAAEIGVVLDAAIADGPAKVGPVVGAMRAAVDPAHNGGARLAVLAVLGWPGSDAGLEPARRDLVTRILQIVATAV